MENLENKIEQSFFGRITSYLGKKTSLYLLAGGLALGGLGYGCESDEATTYKSECHELVAKCDPNSECTIWAKEMIKQGEYSSCVELKRTCDCYKK